VPAAADPETTAVLPAASTPAPNKPDPTSTVSNTKPDTQNTYYCNPVTMKTLYTILNTVAVLFHLVNTVAIGALHDTHFRHIKDGYVFISPVAQLDWTNHALIRVEATENSCSDVANSPHFIATIPSNLNHSVPIFPPRTAYPDFMELFDFTDTTLITYNVPGNELNLNMMMMCFCLLSALFQSYHWYLLCYLQYETMPRFLHYLEYAFSSPLMIMVMAVNVGIKEIFTITCLAALFFGMNILGLCAEVMAHYAGHIEKGSFFVYMEICKLIHLAGWVLFFFALCPIWIQFNQVLKCSENGGTPAYAYAAIVVESFLFFLFGFLQMNSLIEKFQFVLKHKLGNEDTLYGYVFNHMYGTPARNGPPSVNEDKTVHIEADTLFKYDCMHATLSLVAKTMLAWILLGPALSVDPDVLP
jgi:hypothetical protein